MTSVQAHPSPAAEATPNAGPSTVDGPVEAPPAPPFNPLTRPITDAERTAMTGVSWREGCPVPLDDLRVLELPYHAVDGQVRRGELIVHHDVAADVTRAFGGLFEAGFVITDMQPVRAYGGDDNLSMAKDNTSAFNCRPSLGSASWSEHAYGRAIDINPLRNPYVRGDRVDPPGGREWLDRDSGKPGVIAADSPAVRAFRDIDWTWGGTWTRSKDYQHFSRSGR